MLVCAERPLSSVPAEHHRLRPAEHCGKKGRPSSAFLDPAMPLSLVEPLHPQLRVLAGQQPLLRTNPKKNLFFPPAQLTKAHRREFVGFAKLVGRTACESRIPLPSCAADAQLARHRHPGPNPPRSSPRRAPPWHLCPKKAQPASSHPGSLTETPARLRLPCLRRAGRDLAKLRFLEATVLKSSQSPRDKQSSQLCSSSSSITKGPVVAAVLR